MIKLGILGCGDVFARRYRPGLRRVADRVEVVACCDPVAARAQAAANLCEARWPRTRVYTEQGAFFNHPDLQAIFNLTPAPMHAATTAVALDAGLDVFSEKPLAGTIDQGQGLIQLAAARGRLLLCAPAVLATSRFRWIANAISSGRLGKIGLMTAQLGDLGPAAWRAYTGDPRIFYARGVGPLVDQGIYLLHAVTGVLGPARRVTAMGGISMPDRTVVAGPHAGERIDVTARDQVLIQLEFEGPAFAQVLSSYAVPGTRMPTVEVHGSRGTISLDDHLSANGPLHVFIKEEDPSGLAGWLETFPADDDARRSVDDVVGVGAQHFVDCLDGRAEPVLTAQHALHCLEVALAAEQSIELGRVVELSGTFDQPLAAVGRNARLSLA